MRLVKNDDGQVVAARMLSLDLNDAQASALSEIDTLEEVSIQECDAITGSCLAEIAALPNLKSLRILLTPVSDASLAHISQAAGLEQLKLTNVPVTDEGLAFLADCQKLQDVQLTNLEISDQALKHVATLAQLESLTLWNCPQINGSGLDDLSGLSLLTRLDITGTSILTNGAVHLAGHPQLTELNFDPEECTDEVAATLSQITALERLVLAGAPITDEGLARVSELAFLNVLELAGCQGITVPGLRALEGHPALQKLDLSHCRNMSDECIAPLSTISGLNTVLLNNTPFTEAGARALKEVLPNTAIVYGAEPNTEQL